MGVENRSVVVRLRAEMGQYKREMDQAARQAEQLAARGQKAGTTMSSAFKAAAGAAAAVGIGALVKSSVELEAAFSKTMAQVAVATSAPQRELERLNDLAMELGTETVFSAQEAASAMLELAKGGLSTAEIEAGALAETLTLASAGGLELGDAAKTVVQTMGAFGLGASQTGEAVAALAGAANASSADVSDISQALAQAGTEAAAAGLSVQETTAILASFADAGIKGSDAGTSLRTMLTRLVPQTDEAAGEMRRLGLSFTDANGEFVSAEQIAGRLQQAYAGMSAEERTASLTTVFGADARRAANVLIGEGAKGVREYETATSDLTQAEKLAAAANSGTAGAIEQLSGAVETAKIQLGQGLAPVMQDLAGKASDLVESGDIEGWAKAAGEGIADFLTEMAPLAESAGELAENSLPALASAGGTVVDVLQLAADVMTPVVSAFNKLPDSAQQALILATGVKMLGNRLGGVSGEAGSAGESLIVVGDSAEKAGDKSKGAAGKISGLVGSLKGFAILTGVTFGLGEASHVFDNVADGIARMRDESDDLASTMSRNGTSTADTYGALVDRFNDGSIGKFAEDLGVDLDELAESLAKSGAEGEYVREVLGDVADSGSFSKELGSMIPFLETGGEQSAQFRLALEDLIAEMDEAHEKAARTGEDMNNLAIDLLFADGSTRGLAAQLKSLPPEAKTAVLTPGAVESKADVLKLAEAVKLTPTEVRTVMEALDFATPQIEEVVDAVEDADGKTAKPKLDADTAGARTSIKWVENKVDHVDGLYATFGVKANINPAESAIASIIRSLNSIPLLRTITIRTRRVESASKSDRGNEARAPKAGGGPIVGAGGPRDDLVPIDASPGEHMWTAAEVEALGGHGAMYALRTAVRGGAKPRFADGGAVDDAWDQSYRSAAAAYAVPVPSVAAAPNTSTPATGVLSASLAGARVEFGKDGLARFVDGRVDLVLGGAQNHAAINRRAGRGR